MNEIRFDLEDIFNGNLVEDILYSINMMSDKIQFKEVKFWHNGGIADKQLDEFIEQSRKIISQGFPIRLSKKSPQIEYAWFDVISDAKAKGSKCRFSYIYPATKKAEMIRGLHNFSNVVTFIENAGQGKRIYYKPKDNGK